MKLSMNRKHSATRNHKQKISPDLSLCTLYRFYLEKQLALSVKCEKSSGTTNITTYKFKKLEDLKTTTEKANALFVKKYKKYLA